MELVITNYIWKKKRMKISKALKLGTNNNNENEAQSAILAAQRLMAKYHISQEEINDFINENEEQETQVIEENATDEINNEKWKSVDCRSL